MTNLLSQITTAANSDDPALMKKALCLVESVMMAEAMGGAPFRIDTDSDFATPHGADRAAIERRTVEMIATAMAVVFHGDATEWLGFMSKAKQFRALFPLAAHAMAGGWQDIGTAPRDEWILLYCPEDQSRWFAKWQGGEWYGSDCEHGITRTGHSLYDPDYVTGWFVSHWQPLPAPPLPTPRPYTLKEIRDGRAEG